jgi:hypothetical protein
LASQGSDKLTAILAEARAKAEAARAAGPPQRTPAETRRVEALLDRNEALPDSRALARLYQSQELVEKLPEDEDSSPPPAAPGPEPSASAGPSRPPLSRAQIREVMNELTEQFTGNSYVTYEAKPLPLEVIPMAASDGPEVVPIEEPNELFYIVGAVVAMLVIGIFLVLALNGPLRYHPPAGGPSPSPSASTHR